jgi:hypothetical protein
MIRSIRPRGNAARSIAASLNVTVETIRCVIAHKTWKEEYRGISESSFSTWQLRQRSGDQNAIQRDKNNIV